MQDVMFVRLLKNADGNKDGKISREELSARQDALFTEIDANKDGTVTRGELMDFRQARLDEFRKNNPQPEQAENSDGDRHHRDRDRHDARWDGQRHGGMMGRGLFRMVDEDRDGKITKAEVTTAGDQLFTRMDVNKDGTISIDDVPDRPL
jgi:Ca2+-binding EF-hand superfamily protein